LRRCFGSLGVGQSGEGNRQTEAILHEAGDQEGEDCDEERDQVRRRECAA
jgi:hypothetical protein